MVGDSAGLAVAVGVGVADRDAYIDALTRGLGVYEVREAAPGRLRATHSPPSGPAPSFDAGGRQIGAQRFHVGHGCPVKDQRPVTASPSGPPPVPVKPGGHRDGPLQPGAPSVAATDSPPPPGPAVYANRPPSEPGAVRCHICRKLIDQTKPFAGIHHGRWVWAVHDECD